jgi:hypothetical protein
VVLEELLAVRLENQINLHCKKNKAKEHKGKVDDFEELHSFI